MSTIAWIIGAFFTLGGIGAMFKPEKNITRKQGAIFAVVGIIMVVVGWNWNSEEDAKREALETAARAAEKAEDRRKGFHCLSAWDGSQRDLERYVKDHLRDPDSYEHIKTLISPVSDIGTHNISMQFRARNGFGGMTIGSASAVITQEGCKLVTASIDGN
ncbi:hypothetical protein [Thalassospira sp. MIT1370]|uniref:hypothetical protein n=1 Tax=unclassified Thalassospira TaxID=2648997 RepID=UPI00399AF67F